MRQRCDEVPFSSLLNKPLRQAKPVKFVTRSYSNMFSIADAVKRGEPQETDFFVRQGSKCVGSTGLGRRRGLKPPLATRSAEDKTRASLRRISEAARGDADSNGFTASAACAPHTSDAAWRVPPPLCHPP